jgi:hypothetical protein
MRRFLAVVGSASMLAIIACTSFTAAPSSGSGDAGSAAEGGTSGDGSADGSALSCAAPSCAGAGPSCSSSTFDTDCGKWTFHGDPSGVTKECTSGKLRVAAEGTLDVTAELALTTPGELTAVAVSGRIAVAAWDGGPLLGVRLDGVVVAIVNAVTAASGNIRLRLCDEAALCASDFVEIDVGTEHVFALDVTSAGVAFTVDCRPVAIRTARISLATNAPLQIEFGKVDANPISGTLDDVVVAYR